ncbi:hypothetical protein HF878_03930 [Selenomonas bovis]|uniref:Uncharacterized protein n=1 Tax=Selenomonas bovis TaxID=416586 RepID=A0A848B3X7_9FIRM|nr:hypothetical protein [Selenomonas bovis]NMD98633.1 hypothetical protein [Selenomonas bovis]
MRKNDLDETVLLKKVNPSRPRSEDTQSMPAVQPPGGDPALTQETRRGTVHELDPLPPDRLQRQPEKVPFWTKRRKKKAILAGGFLCALLLGFLFAGYKQHQEEEQATRARIQQEQAANQARDAASLAAKKAELEQEKQELEKKKQELMLQAARAEGKNEQLAEDRGSLLGKFVDKVTGGKEKQKAANTAERDAAKQAAQQVDASLAQAQQMLDDVNAQLDHNGKLQEAAETVRTGAQDAYENHKDVIDRVGTYLIDGIRLAADKILQR